MKLTLCMQAHTGNCHHHFDGMLIGCWNSHRNVIHDLIIKEKRQRSHTEDGMEKTEGKGLSTGLGERDEEEMAESMSIIGSCA